MKKPTVFILSFVFVIFAIALCFVVKINSNNLSNKRTKIASEVAKVNIVSNASKGLINNIIRHSSSVMGTNPMNNASKVVKTNPINNSSRVAEENSINNSSSEEKTNLSTVSSKNSNKKKPSRGIENTNPNFTKTYYSHKVIVLTYHHISKETFGGITIKPERFEADLKMLREKGFHVIRFSDLIQGMEGKYEIPDNAVVITFDDGISSVYDYAFPLLQKYNAQATSFLVTSRNQSYKQFTASDKPLSPEEITEMFQSGFVEFQSHTNQSHEYVYINSKLKKGAKLTNRIYNKNTRTMESHEEYVNRVVNDLSSSRDLIFKYTGVYADALCFPFGIYNKETIELAQKCGYKYFVTTQNGTNYQNSKKNKIYRIRAGDQKLDSNKLYYSIIDIAN